MIPNEIYSLNNNIVSTHVTFHKIITDKSHDAGCRQNNSFFGFQDVGKTQQSNCQMVIPQPLPERMQNIGVESKTKQQLISICSDTWKIPIPLCVCVFVCGFLSLQIQQTLYFAG